MAAYTITTGNVVMIQAFGNLYGQRIMNQFFYLYKALATRDDGPAAVRGLADNFQTIVWNAWKNLVTDSYELDWIQSTRVYPNRQAYEYKPVNETGLITADVALPPANSLTYSRVGELPGRGKQSSLHIAGMGTDDTLAGEWTAAAITRGSALQTSLVAKLANDIADPDAWWPCNHSFKYPNVENPIRLVFPDNEVRTVTRRVVRQGV